MHHASLHPIVSALDTSGGPNLIHRSFFLLSWRKHIWPTLNLCPKLASNERIQVEGTFYLVVLLGDLHARFTFGVVDKMVVSILLGTSYIDRFIALVFHLIQQIAPVHSSLIAILASYSYNKGTNDVVTNYADKYYNNVQLTNEQKGEQTKNWSIPVRTSRESIIPVFGESPALDTMSGTGLIALNTPPNVAKNRTARTAKRHRGSDFRQTV